MKGTTTYHSALRLLLDAQNSLITLNSLIYDEIGNPADFSQLDRFAKKVATATQAVSDALMMSDFLENE